MIETFPPGRRLLGTIIDSCQLMFQKGRSVGNSLLLSKRILVVEDEGLVSMLIEDALLEEGATVVGPFATLADALDAAQTQEFDAALLDVNLRGKTVYPVAELLSERGIPFLLLTGYGETSVSTAHPDWWTCPKPFKLDDLVNTLARRMISQDAKT
jgi:DNA-binding response OmpR family regulator